MSLVCAHYFFLACEKMIKGWHKAEWKGHPGGDFVDGTYSCCQGIVIWGGGGVYIHWKSTFIYNIRNLNKCGHLPIPSEFPWYYDPLILASDSFLSINKHEKASFACIH